MKHQVMKTDHVMKHEVIKQTHQVDTGKDGSTTTRGWLFYTYPGGGSFTTTLGGTHQVMKQGDIILEIQEGGYFTPTLGVVRLQLP